MADITNTNPVLRKDNLSMDEDTVLTITPLANDNDADGDTLNITKVEGLVHGVAVINPDNTITYTPNENFNGTESFLYTVSDGKGGVATQRINVTILPVADDVEPNVAPSLGKDSAVVAENTPTKINVLANDTDANGDTLIITAVAGAANGKVTINPDNTVTYTPNKNYAGTDTFIYTVSDGNGGTATQRVNVVVEDTMPNVAPVLIKDSAVVDEDSSVTINVLANDTDANDDELKVTAVSGVKNGVAVINADNTITYTPNANYNGTESFLYTVSDGMGGTATQRVNITINPVADDVEPNSTPVLLKDSANVSATIPTFIDVLRNDRDADGDDLTIVSVGRASKGILSINDDNTLIYVPNAGATGKDSFLYTVDDGKGGVATQRVNVILVDTSATDPASVIVGTNADNILNGTANVDVVYGLAGDDDITGGYGDDVLFGGAGADLFIFTPDGGVDVIKDFSLIDGDSANFDALFFDYDPLADDIIDFLSASQAGNNTVVSVDRDGSGTEYDWQVVAIVENVILPPIESSLT